MTATTLTDLTIRPSTDRDQDGLRRLAQLDSADPIGSAVLIAEEAGEIVAALRPVDGVAIANPFRHTARTVELLRARAAALESDPGRRGVLRRRRRALRPSLVGSV